MCDATDVPEAITINRLPATETACCGVGPPLHDSEAVKIPA
jgi:hypothetical protein